ncbi:MAG: PLDc N-terminal domain-containing protein [Reichenbachiella sp.]
MLEAIVAIIAAALTIWALILVSKSKMKKTNKVIWFIIVVFLPIAGPVVFMISSKLYSA